MTSTREKDTNALVFLLIKINQVLRRSFCTTPSHLHADECYTLNVTQFKHDLM